ncbi:hypothetical protein ECP03047993_3075 [Escherichia coli P0304799.3]|nr:hypothetical protein ECP03047993_3075 [Escherichia coli P0304799.3]
MQAHRRLNAKAGGKYIFTGQIFQRPGDAAFSVQFFQLGVSFCQRQNAIYLRQFVQGV